MKLRNLSALVCSAILLAFPFASANAVQDGWFVGGSIGWGFIESDIADPDLPNVESFDESDFAWKVYGGYNWVFARTFGFGIEGGYVNFGSPSDDVASVLPVKIEPTALDLFATLGFDLGPIGIFGKLGYAWWDVDLDVGGEGFSDDGNDPVYGIGARFNLFSLEIRGEYEYFDIDDVDDVSLWSLGVVWRF